MSPPPSPQEGGAIILVGMPGVGKSAIGREVALRLGREFFDTDALVEARTGTSIPAIFEREGEAGFRALERSVVAELVESPGVRDAVIATGGFTIGDSESRRALEAIGMVVRLVAPPDVIAERAARGEGGRPLLAAPDAASIARLKADRRAVYGSVPWCVETGSTDVAGAAEAVIALWRAIGSASRSDVESPSGQVVGSAIRPDAESASGRAIMSRVRAVPIETPPAGGYELLVGSGLLDVLGAVLAARGIGATSGGADGGAGGGVAIVTDTTVGPLYAERVRHGLSQAGMDSSIHKMGVGETEKSPETARRIAEELAAAGHGRDVTLIGLGGGVVTDTAGFVAATYMRGVRLVMAPTTLLAMVDAAIGGKTGVNLDAGKNLLGAFHQPVLVAADASALDTLPEATLRAGLAEVVKAALIDDPTLLDALDAGLPVDAEGWSELITRAAAVKARIVSTDPFERTGGPRERLNLGHTFAHAIEHASDHAVTHGEAVAIGLVLAARLSAALRVAEDGLADDIAARLERLGLPTRLPASAGSPEALLAAMGVDKKRRGGRNRFVLIRAPGEVMVSDDVPAPAVIGVIETG